METMPSHEQGLENSNTSRESVAAPREIAEKLASVQTWRELRTLLDTVGVVVDARGSMPVHDLYVAIVRTATDSSYQFSFPTTFGIADVITRLRASGTDAGSSEEIFVDVLGEQYVQEAVRFAQSNQGGFRGFLRRHVSPQGRQAQHDHEQRVRKLKEAYVGVLKHDDTGYSAWRSTVLPHVEKGQEGYDSRFGRNMYALERLLALEQTVTAEAQRTSVPSWWDTVTNRARALIFKRTPHVEERGRARLIIRDEVLQELGDPTKSVRQWKALNTLHYSQAKQIDNEEQSLVQWVEAVAQRVAEIQGSEYKMYLPTESERMREWLERIRGILNSVQI